MEFSFVLASKLLTHGLSVGTCVLYLFYCIVNSTESGCPPSAAPPQFAVQQVQGEQCLKAFAGIHSVAGHFEMLHIATSA